MSTEPRPNTRACLAILFGATAGACAFSDGRPWGELEVSVTARFDEAGRATSDGYRTSNDYVVRVDSFTFALDAVSVAMAAGDAALSFDPASPPPGYSLCHNGHCHADDGRLVDYADIAAELAGGAASGATVVGSLQKSALLTPAGTAFSPTSCSDDCALPLGRLALATLSTTGVSAQLHVSDRLTGNRRRLPAGGIDIDITLAEVIDFDAALNKRIDGRAPPVIALSVDFVIPATVFDGVDWTDDAATAAQLSARLAEAGFITATIDRRNFD